MRNRYQQIFMLYLTNPSFPLIWGLLLLSTVLSRFLYHSHQIFYAEEFYNVLFVVSLWLVFHMGILIKRQLATSRASLMPGYRAPHINVLILFYLALILLGYWWSLGVKLMPVVSDRGELGGYLICLLIAMLFTYLGYLSIGRVLIYAYLILLVFSYEMMDFITVIDGSALLLSGITVACVCVALFLIVRFYTLKDEDFEYSYLFTWPPRKLFVDQLKAGHYLSDLLSPLTKGLQGKAKDQKIPHYRQHSNIFARAAHWDYTEQTNPKLIWVLMFLSMSLFLYLMHQTVKTNLFSMDVYESFILLSVTPLFISIGGNYKRLSYWGYDLIKPVTRKQYIKEQGIVLMTNLLLCWLLFAGAFAILPNLVFHQELIISVKFWGYLALTLNFSFLMFFWLAVLSCSTNSIFVIVQGALLGLVMLFFFYCSSKFSLEQMLIQNLICLAGNVLLASRSYQAWCKKEFLE